MKILFDIEVCFVNTTGIARYTKEILSELIKQDTQNSYVLFHSSDIESSQYEWMPPLPDNFQVLRIPRSGRTITIFSLMGFGGRLIQKEFPEDIDLYFSTTAFLLPIKSRHKIGMIHDLSPYDCPSYFPWRDMQIGRRSFSQLAKTADRILTVSKFSQQKILNKWKLRQDEVGVVANAGWSASSLEASNGTVNHSDVPAKYGIDKPYFLWCGAMWKRKNVTALIEALGEFKKHINDDTLLVLAGTRGNQSEEVDQLALELDLEKYIRHIGFVDDEDMPGLMRGATAFVFPSMYEGFGIPVLEAMACGTPVIASNTSSLPEVIENAGILVDPTIPSTIAESMMDIARSPELRQRLSELGETRAAAYSWSRSARTLLETFEEVYKDNA